MRSLLLFTLAAVFTAPSFGGIIIDDFDTGPQGFSLGNNSSATQTVSASGAFKGTRSGRLQTFNSTSSLQVSDGIAQVSTIGGITTFYFWWDGDLVGGDAPGASNPAVDLTGHVVQLSYRSNVVVPFEFRYYTDSSSLVGFSALLPATGLGTNPFSTITLNTSAPSFVVGTPTLSAVRSFYISATPSAGGTVELDFVATVAPVPEPGTVALMGSALAGLALWAQRRRVRN
jgi:hypothetical protein